MIGKALIAAMTGDSTVYSLIGDRIYPLVYPAEPTFPLVTYRVIAGYHEPVIDEQVTTSRVQLDAWAETYSSAATVKDALMSLFNHLSGTYSGQAIIQAKVDLTFDQFEQNLKIYRAVVDLRIVHEGT